MPTDDIRDASDAILVVGVGRYRQEALAEAYRRHAGAVFALARRLLVDRAMADLHARVAELSIELAEKVVERSLDRETNLALIENYINQVGATS